MVGPGHDFAKLKADKLIRWDEIECKDCLDL